MNKDVLQEKIDTLHRAACLRGEAGYIDPTSGYFVLTAVFLERRKNCCGAGCRHCPYSPEQQIASGRPTVTRRKKNNVG